MNEETMRERYESLPLAELRAVAKARGLKGISTLRKDGLVQRMLDADREEKVNAEKEDVSKTIKTEKNTREVKKNTGGAQKTEDSQVKKDRDESQTKKDRDESQAKKDRDDKTRKRKSRQPFVKQAAEEYPRKEESAASAPEPIKPELSELDSGNEARGILEVLSDGYGFIRSDNFLPGEDDVYVSPSQIRRFGLRTGDIVCGNTRVKSQNEKYSALLFVKSVNGDHPAHNAHRVRFEDMTPVFPDKRIHLERPGGSTAMRIVDLVSPIGKGQRGMIVSPPKAGKTTLLKDAAKSILRNDPDMHLIVLLIDERPEEVTDIKETVRGNNVEVIYSTFDELPEHHKRVSEMVIERAKRLVESKKDVIIFIDSITRLARAYNQVVPPSGRTLSGGLDPAALHMPKRFFGAARNMREGGSLTILATALVETGSKMDDVVYEEFKGTGNMELILDRKLQERRVFPAIDLAKSGTRREDLLLSQEEQDAVNIMRRALNGMKAEEAGENILNLFTHTKSNQELVDMMLKRRVL